MTENKKKDCYSCEYYSFSTDGWCEEPYCTKINDWINPYQICEYYTERIRIWGKGDVE